MKKLLLTLVVLTLLPMAIYAQPLFTYLTDAGSGFSPTELDKIDSLRDNPLHDSVYIVSVGNFWSQQNNGSIHINLPGSNVTEAFVQSMNIQDVSNPGSAFTWNGFFQGLEQDENGDYNYTMNGAVHLFKENGEIYGILSSFEDYTEYNLISIGQGKNALIKYKTSTVAVRHTDCTPSEPTNTTARITADDPCKPVRVLFLYSDKAQAVVANIPQEVNKAMGLLAGGVYNSLGSDDIYAKFTTAGIVYLDPSYYLPGGNKISDDSKDLSNNMYAQYYRNLYTADLVIYLSDENYSNYAGNARSIGPINDSAYAIYEADLLNTDYGISHEIGHLMGCRHQQSSVSNLGPGKYDDASGYDHGYQIKTGLQYWYRRYIDIMHVNYNGARKDHLFSTPNVKWRNQTYGTSNNNSAQTLMDNHCTVSDFRDDEFDFFDAYTYGPGLTTTGATVSVSAYPVNGAGSGYPYYDYEWYVSFDGGNTWSSNGTYTNEPWGSVTQFTMPDVPVATIWVKVTDAVNQTKVLTKNIFNTAPKWIDHVHIGPSASGKPTGLNTVAGENSILIISPNPAVNTVNLRYEVLNYNKEATVTLTIIDMTGKILMTKQQQAKIGDWAIDVSALPAGNYIVQMTGANATATKKFTVIK